MGSQYWSVLQVLSAPKERNLQIIYETDVYIAQQLIQQASKQATFAVQSLVRSTGDMTQAYYNQESIIWHDACVIDF